jgi:hypothetical protein
MIVVSSHVNYIQAWRTLRESMVEHGQDMRDVVVVIAGAEKEAIDAENDDKEVYIYIPFNFYEVTAIYGVYRYIDHPRLNNANSFILVHDTSIALAGFPEKCQEMSRLLEKDNLELIYFTPTRQLNQLILSREFVRSHGHSWGRNGTKHDAWNSECDGIYSFYYLADHCRVLSIGDPIIYPPPVRYKDSNIYRHPIHITPINLIKLVANNDEHVNPHWSQRSRP